MVYISLSLYELHGINQKHYWSYIYIKSRLRAARMMRKGIWNEIVLGLLPM
jgi:hypothetical protein